MIRTLDKCNCGFSELVWSVPVSVGTAAAAPNPDSVDAAITAEGNI